MSELNKLNDWCSKFESRLNESNKLNSLFGYLSLVRQCMGTPSARMVHSVNAKFVSVMNTLQFLLGDNLKQQVDLATRKMLAKEQALILECSHMVFLLYTGIIDYVQLQGVFVDENLRNKILLKTPAQLVSQKYCDISSIYVESKFMDIIQTMCANVFGGKWKEQICNLINVLIQQKQMVDNASELTVAMIDQYIIIWNSFQAHLLRLVFTNFIVFHNAGVIRCLGVYFDQQIQIKIDLLQQRKNILLEEGKNILPQLIW